VGGIIGQWGHSSEGVYNRWERVELTRGGRPSKSLEVFGGDLDTVLKILISKFPG